MRLKILLTLVVVLASISGPVAATTFEEYFQTPEFGEVDLSPDGRYLAALARKEEAVNLVVLDIDTMEARALTDFETREVTSFWWANHERLVFNVRSANEEDSWHSAAYEGSYLIDRDGSKWDAIGNSSLSGVGEDVYVRGYVSMLREDPDKALAEVAAHRRFFSDIRELDLRTGRVRRTVAGNFAEISEWFVDGNDVIRAAVDGDLDSLDERLLYRKDEDSEWEEVLSWEFDDEVDFDGFMNDGRTMVISHRIGRDRQVVQLFDPETRTWGEVLAEHPTYDVGGVIWLSNQHVNGRRIIGYSWLGEHYERKMVDSLWRDVQAMVDQAFPDTVNRIEDISDDETRALVRAYSDKVPRTYYLLDLEPEDQATPKLKYLVASRPWIDPQTQSETRPVSYTTRDGETVHGYLTLPPGVEGPEELPLIIHPHGGPYGIRDDWGWEAERQFLASHGWAVLQMNYRGSGGYGKRWETMGYYEMGLSMQDDITDAVSWAVDSGIADPERVCIYGASYGGYATLAGLTFTPDLYACGASYVGNADIERWVRDSRNSVRNYAGLAGGREAWLKLTYGDLDDEADLRRFRETSPMNHVQNIQAPLFVTHGLLDGNVPPIQYRGLVSELKDHGVNFEHYLERKEGHGYRTVENQREYYDKLVRFLRRSLE